MKYLAVLTLTFILAGCFNPLDYNPEAGHGVIVVAVPGRNAGNRPALSVAAELLLYRFTFSGPGGETIVRDLASGAASLTVSVSPGDWSVHVDARTAGGLPYAVGDAFVSVSGGTAVSVTIAMRRTAPLLTSVADVTSWINEAITIDGEAGSAALPVPLRMEIDLANSGGNGWADLLGAIYTAGKYVALDLAACGRGPDTTPGSLYNDGTFDPYGADTDPDRVAAKGKIVSLVLPDAATGIKAGMDYSNAAFRYFAELKSVSGAYIATVGAYAFYSCGGLTTVSLPTATNIGTFAFTSTGLTLVNLPAATSIGSNAFRDCTGLSSVTLSSVAVINIGDLAFQGCTALAALSLPATPPALGNNVFYETNLPAGAGTTLAITVPSGKVSAYTSTTPPGWNVSEIREAGNSVYGSYHKRIVITDNPSLLTSVSAVTAYLAEVSGGTSAGSPVTLPVSLNLADTGGNGWGDLLSAIQSKGKFVALDLSTSSVTGMTGTPGEFDPGTANTGESRIVSLVLPAAAESIKAGTGTSTAFKHFTALTSVGGANIGTVGDWAFYGCSSLSSVELSSVDTIGHSAFGNCSSLTTVDLPATFIGDYAFVLCTGLSSADLSSATSIGEGAFQDCTSLSSLTLPVAATIGNYAFAHSGLSSLTLPVATSIGDGAFQDCSSLSLLTLPVAATIGNYAFASCTGLSTLSLPANPPMLTGSGSAGAFYYTHDSDNPSTLSITVPSSSAVSDYMSTWGVAADTAAEENEAVYGDEHKRIVITP